VILPMIDPAHLPQAHRVPRSCRVARPLC
jgi:hypothetical protein